MSDLSQLRESEERYALDVERELMRTAPTRASSSIRKISRYIEKFTPGGGAVMVSAQLHGATAEIKVRDSGVGISLEDQQALFQEFRRVGRDARRKAEGAGLGLALTKRFVELHGGAIHLESAPGKGSTFTITLPLRSSPPQ